MGDDKKVADNVYAKSNDDERLLKMRSEIDGAVRGIAMKYPDMNFGVVIGLMDFLAGFYTGTAIAFDPRATDDVMLAIHNANYGSGLAMGKGSIESEMASIDRSKLN